MKVIYLAHQLSAPTREGIEENRRSAAKWAGWLSTTFRIAIVADWIWLTGELEETEENRAWGLACDKAQIERCDALFAVGPTYSTGMRIETVHAVDCKRGAFNLIGLPMDEAVVRKALADQGWFP